MSEVTESVSLSGVLFAQKDDQESAEVRFWRKALFAASGFAAYSSYLALFFINVFFSASYGDAFGSFRSVSLIVGFFAGLLFACVAGWRFSDQFSSGRGVVFLTAAAFLLSPVAVVSHDLNVDFSIVMVFFALAGSGVAFFLMLASTYVGRISRNLLVVSVPSCVVVAILVAVAVLYIRPGLLCKIFTLFVAALGALSSLVVNGAVLKGESSYIHSEESRERNRMSWKSSAAVLSQSCCLSYAMIFMVLVGIFHHEQVVLIAGGVAIASAIVVVFDSMSKEKAILVSEKNQLRFFLPCAAVGLLPIAFVDDMIVKTVCCCILLFCFSIQAITNIYAVSENVRLFSLQPIGTYACSRIANYGGYLLGAIIALASFGWGIGVNALSEALTLIMVTTLAFVEALFFSDRFPVERFCFDGGKGFSEKDEIKLGAKESMGGDAIEEKSAPAHALSWKRRCGILAGEIGLSPRQEEVLILLSRGYSAKYIEEHLFISYHTVKSHIHGIYQKAGIHSREELIEMIEKISVDNDSCPQ